jgi:protein-S-isoprenylcysteine O-methyltransferase Ste14
MSFTLVPSSWPAVLIGLIILFYWVRVMQMVARTRRQVGRAANLIPPERLGRVLRLIWSPVVLLWIFVPLLTPFFKNPPALLRPYQPVYENPFIGWTAFAIAAAAFYMTWICWRKMGKSWRMGIDPNERTQLVFTGPYAYVKHPIYALSSLLMLTSIAAVCSPLMVMVGMLHVVLIHWEARREEKFLTVLHGPAYSDYAAKVGRFFPRILK